MIMDINSALSREIFRPLAITLCPGPLATTPWIALLILSNPAIAQLVSSYTGAAAFLYLIACIASGLVLENIGSHIENYHWNAALTANPALKDEWNQYLQLRINNEIIGQRYLREILFRAKFELSTAPALIILATGILAIQWQHSPWTGASTGILASAAVATGLWLCRESRESVRLLGDIRHQILASTHGGAAAAGNGRLQ